MRRRRVFIDLCLIVLVLLTAECTKSGGQSNFNGDGGSDGGAGSYVLTATNTGPTYEPTFTGNGELGIRVPPVGQGYAGGSVPAEAQLAGFYAQPPGGVQQRAAIPDWSSLVFSEGGQSFALGSGRVRQWRQAIDLKTGTITTSAVWTGPGERVTRLSYLVMTDRARADLAVVRLTLTPEWSGSATVTDSIDGSSATLSTQVAKGWKSSARQDWVVVQASGTGIEAAVASQLTASADVKGSISSIDQTTDQSVGQSLEFHVLAGESYTLTKYVGVVSSGERSSAAADARKQVASAAERGFGALVDENNAAWATLWSGRIDVLGNNVLATDVNASEFYLWSSTRQGVDWSVSPGGLSSNGYNGHIFWDAETWMYPALLPQHPDLASEMDDYRYTRLAAARAHAAATGYAGARYPWESALDGTEQIPPPDTLFSEGLYEQHITADVAIAQWQYYLATGDRTWLAKRGWPVISAAASFWASRVTEGPGGTYHITGVTGPDEEHEDVDDDVYTNAAVATSLKDAVTAARVLGLSVPKAWTSIASNLVVPMDSSLGINPEFSGYTGSMIKQADATMLEYPLEYPLARGVAQADVNYYAVRTDPNGPSMSDSIDSIDTSALAATGCASYVYTLRSVQPFIHDVFDQFSETRSGGVLTFMTGIGGFLQEFLYGYSGLRWSGSAVDLSPNLSGHFTGVVLHRLSWHGRLFTLTIGEHYSTVEVDSGRPLPVRVGGKVHEVEAGAKLVIHTRRPDLARAGDAALCGSVSASSSGQGAPPLGAVDGSPATDWQPLTVPATLTVEFAGGAEEISTATVTWGQTWPPPQSLTQPPPPGPVTVLRGTDYVLEASVDGSRWRTVATVTGRSTGTEDQFSFPAMRARYFRIRITASTNQQPPMLSELTVGS